VRHCRLRLHLFAACPENIVGNSHNSRAFRVGSHGGVGWELRRLYKIFILSSDCDLTLIITNQ
jgi:hypothetical protein